MDLPRGYRGSDALLGTRVGGCHRWRSMPSLNRSMWSRLVAVGLPFFKAKPRGRVLGGLVLLVVLLLTINGLNVVNSYIGRDFMTALAERHARRFFIFAGILAGVFAI